jgi:hypothetical protein
MHPDGQRPPDALSSVAHNKRSWEWYVCNVKTIKCKSKSNSTTWFTKPLPKTRKVPKSNLFFFALSGHCRVSLRSSSSHDIRHNAVLALEARWKLSIWFWNFAHQPQWYRVKRSNSMDMVVNRAQAQTTLR